MTGIPQARVRGIQEDDVWGAADALLAEGLRPTIERVRQKIGRGSPNTVSPLLERWFASLAARLAGGTDPSANLAAGHDADGVPVSVRNATRLLWETARREAQELQRQAMEATRRQLDDAQESLRGGQAELAQREAAFAQARASLDAALASSQQAREALERQLAERTAAQGAEMQRLRTSSEHEIVRLNALLQEAHAAKEVLRDEQAAALAARERDLREAQARHAAQEECLLAEVDRARQSARQLEVGMAKEQQQRIQSEDAAARTLEAGRRALRETQEAAQQLERQLRDQLASQAVALAQAQSQGAALQQRLDDLLGQLNEEKKSHEGTRALLTRALAAKGSAIQRAIRKPAIGKGKA